MAIVYIGLGSNLGDREQFLRISIEKMSAYKGITVQRCSSVYETAPVGIIEQPPFLNMVIELATSYSPLQLLDIVQEIEESCGRLREQKWGPRTLDLDILLYNHENMKTERLEIPHPRMGERGFVLIPLYEINAPLVMERFSTEYKNVKNQLGKDVDLWKRKEDFSSLQTVIKQ